MERDTSRKHIGQHTFEDGVDGQEIRSNRYDNHGQRKGQKFENHTPAGYQYMFLL